MASVWGQGSPFKEKVPWKKKRNLSKNRKGIPGVVAAVPVDRRPAGRR
jgi:hypothetical protein